MTFAIIGLDSSTSEQAVAYLEGGGDSCFGKHYAKTSPECISCRAPVIHNGRVVLMKEVCAMVSIGDTSVARLKKLTSQDVLERLEKGVSIQAIFKEILDTAPPGQLASAARTLLMDRLLYLKSIGLGGDIKVPRTKELLGDSNE